MMNAGRAFALVALAASLPLATACGDDDPGGGGTPDGGVVLPPDAAIPDAEPPPPDAKPADLSCADDPIEVTPVPAKIHVGATVVTTSGQAIAPIADAEVEVFANSDDATPLATGKTDATGKFDLEITTHGQAFDGYASIKAETKVPIYLFFADPLRADSTDNQLTTVDPALFQNLAPLGVMLQPGDGLIGLRIEDCEGVGYSGAQINVQGGDGNTQIADLGEVAQLLGQAALAEQLAGAVGILNVPVVNAKPTPVTVKATLMGSALQDAPLKVFPDSLSYIRIHP